MALYYPPKEGLKGWRKEHWNSSIIPISLAHAIAMAKLFNESIYDSNTMWLILDDKGNIPSSLNAELQPESQLVRADFYKDQVKPTTIKITKAGGTYTPPQYIPAKSWFTRNWMWFAPLSVAVVLILLPPERNE